MCLFSKIAEAGSHEQVSKKNLRRGSCKGCAQKLIKQAPAFSQSHMCFLSTLFVTVHISVDLMLLYLPNNYKFVEITVDNISNICCVGKANKYHRCKITNLSYKMHTTA